MTVPFYSSRAYSRKSILLITVLCVTVFIILFFNTKVYWRNLWKDTVKIQTDLFQYGNFKNDVNAGLKEFKLNEVRAVVSKAEKKYDSIYAHDRVLSFLLQLRKMDDLPIEEKRKSLVYVDFRKLYTHPDFRWKLYCHNIAFIVPALSGMAMIDGIDVTYFDLCPGCCEQIGVSYHYYKKWKSREEIDQEVNTHDLMIRVKEKGFENLLFYNIDNNSFEKKQVKDLPAPS